MEGIYVVLFVCYTSYAYNKKSVSFASPNLIKEGLDTTHAGLILSCQYVASAFSKFAAGILSDRTNPKVVFTAGLLISGLTTVVFSSTSSFSAYCALWFLNGLAQGCGWPSCAKILRQRAPPARFGTLWSILSASSNVSGSLSSLISAYICYNYGWRMSLLVAGMTTLLLVPVCFFGLGSSSEFESKPKKGKDSLKKGIDSGSETFSDLLSDPLLLLVSFGTMVSKCTKATLVDWGPLFLMTEKNRSQLDGSAFVSSVATGGLVGKLAAGIVSDYFMKRGQSASDTEPRRLKSYTRMSIAVFYFFVGFMLMHALRFTVTATTSMVWVTTLGFILGGCIYGPLTIFGIVASESAPVHLSGSANAIASLGGKIGGIISGFPLCYIAKHHSWDTVILLLQVVVGVTLCLMFFFNNIRPKTSRQKKDA